MLSLPRSQRRRKARHGQREQLKHNDEPRRPRLQNPSISREKQRGAPAWTSLEGKRLAEQRMQRGRDKLAGAEALARHPPHPAVAARARR